MAVDTMECLQALERWAKSIRSVVEESPFSKEMEEKCPGIIVEGPILIMEGRDAFPLGVYVLMKLLVPKF